MSIIHDALKKVQHSMGTSSPSTKPLNIPREEIVEVLPSQSQTPKAEKKTSHLIGWSLLSLSMIVTLVSIVYVISQVKSKYPNLLSGANLNISIKLPKITFTRSKEASTKPVAQSSLPVLPSPQEPIKEKTVTTVPTVTPLPTHAAAETTFNLQGIMMASDHHNVALVNNSAYEEGAIINGIKILKIDLTTILIERDGKQETVGIKK